MKLTMHGKSKLLSFFDLPEDIQTENEGFEEETFVKFGEDYLMLGDFIRFSFMGTASRWDGYLGTSYFTATLIKIKYDAGDPYAILADFAE